MYYYLCCCACHGLSLVVTTSLLLSCVKRTSCYVGFSCCRAQALGTWASVVVVLGLSCPAACGIFPDEGSNLSALHWQADS